MECYNFFQQYEDYFATAGAKGQNRVPFAIIFLKNPALICCQQHQRKVEDKTDVHINLKESKTFFCQSLGKFGAFIDTI